MSLAFHIRRVYHRLVRIPGPAVVLVALAAVGPSVASAVSRLDMTVFRPTLFAEPQRLFGVMSAPRTGGDSQRTVSPADYRRLEEIAPSLGVVGGRLLLSRPL